MAGVTRATLYIVKKDVMVLSKILIKNGRVLTMDSQGTIENGAVLAENGKITAVGASIDAPADCEIIDAKGGWILPGLIDAHSHIGIFGTALRWEGSDGNEASDPITPHMRAIDGINPMDREFPIAVEHGITSVATGPGSANPIGGQFVAMKTYGRAVDKMIIRDPLAMKMAFGENPKSVYGPAEKMPITRMATAALIREWLYKAKQYVAKKEAAGADASKMPAYDAKLEALELVVTKKIPIKAHAHRADDILTAIRIADEFDVEVSIEHCTEGHLIAEELAEAGRPVILGPLSGVASKPEVTNMSLGAPAILHKAGVKFAIMTDMPVTHIWFLTLVAGMCVNEGLPEDVAFKAITINAAEILGLGDRIGSLTVGKDADIAVFSENPLRSLSAKCQFCAIDGVTRHNILA